MSLLWAVLSYISQCVLKQAIMLTTVRGTQSHSSRNIIFRLFTSQGGECLCTTAFPGQSHKLVLYWVKIRRFCWPQYLLIFSIFIKFKNEICSMELLSSINKKLCPYASLKILTLDCKTSFQYLWLLTDLLLQIYRSVHPLTIIPPHIILPALPEQTCFIMFKGDFAFLASFRC